MENTERKLDAKTALFCYRFVLSNNETQSVIDAFPSYRSRKAASCKGSNLLKDPAVRQYILRLQKEIYGTEEEASDKAKQVLEELDLIGFSDIRSFYPEGTDERKFLDQAGNTARAVESIEITENKFLDGRIEKNTKFKLHSKMKALELRGKNLKLYTDLIQGTVVTKPEVYVPDNGRNKPANEANG